MTRKEIDVINSLVSTETSFEHYHIPYSACYLAGLLAWNNCFILASDPGVRSWHPIRASDPGIRSWHPTLAADRDCVDLCDVCSLYILRVTKVSHACTVTLLQRGQRGDCRFGISRTSLWSHRCVRVGARWWSCSSQPCRMCSQYLSELRLGQMCP